MSTSVRVKTTVLPGRRVEVTSPDLEEGATVEVLVTPEEPSATATGVDHVALLKLPITEREKVLAEQAELLAGEYGPDEERELWQGGDIIE